MDSHVEHLLIYLKAFLVASFVLATPKYVMHHKTMLSEDGQKVWAMYQSS